MKDWKENRFKLKTIMSTVYKIKTIKLDPLWFLSWRNERIFGIPVGLGFIIIMIKSNKINVLRPCLHFVWKDVQFLFVMHTKNSKKQKFQKLWIDENERFLHFLSGWISKTNGFQSNAVIGHCYFVTKHVCKLKWQEYSWECGWHC